MRALELRRTAPDGFTLIVERPFIVLGDEAPGMVRHRSTATVRWAVDRLKQDFFVRDPGRPIAIWLFRDAASYQGHSRRLFNETPTTPYGFYSARHRAIVMNISTGGGTLVHEIVHPFIEANFPGCPVWFDEGLASLFEQCGVRDGHIVGLVNWRLAGLQVAIREGRTISFEELTSMGRREFYAVNGSGRRGESYAQARYLCLYLQEKGLLRTFYHQFVEGAADDPGGLATLRVVLDEPDMAAFQARWEKFVLGLAFP
jgi:hypothetical protein